MFSPFKVVYNKTRTPNRRKENALIFIRFNAITQGLTALTAYEVGRIDLINPPSAFRDLINILSKKINCLVF